MPTKDIEPFAKDAVVVGVVVMCFLCLLVAALELDPNTLVHDTLVLLGLREDKVAEEKANKILKSASVEYLDAVAEGKVKPEEENEPFTIGGWFRKYFMVKQVLDAKAQERLDQAHEEAMALPPLQRFVTLNRKLISLAIPALLFHLIWWPVMIVGDYWEQFPSKYFMSITMVFGSMFAGCTSEGGAAVAFPVMTLVFDISPKVARDFSFMIQAQGMTAASFAILFMKIKIEWHSIVFCTLGGIIGMIVGLEEVAPLMDPPVKKMFFVCTWAAFASALYYLNRDHGRIAFETIPNYKFWKTCVLLVTGFVGGTFSSIAGSGIDICSFAVLTLFFRVSERTATPTSVVLMGINTVIGFFYREYGMPGGVEAEAWKFLLVCMPIVVFGAPLGSYIGSHLHRLVLAWMVYILDFVQLVCAYALIDFAAKGYPDLPYIGIGIIIGGFLMFSCITYAGTWLMKSQIADVEADAKMEIQAKNAEAGVSVQV